MNEGPYHVIHTLLPSPFRDCSIIRECRLQHSPLALIKFKLCCAVCCVASGSNPALYVLSKCLSFYFLFCCLVPGIRAFFPHLKCTMGLEYAVGQTWAQLKPKVLWPCQRNLCSLAAAPHSYITQPETLHLLSVSDRTNNRTTYRVFWVASYISHSISMVHSCYLSFGTSFIFSPPIGIPHLVDSCLGFAA